MPRHRAMLDGTGNQGGGQYVLLKQSLLMWDIVPPVHFDTEFLSLECSGMGKEFVVRKIQV